MQSKRSMLLLGDEELAHTVTGGTPNRSNPDYFGGNIKWVKSGELNDTWIFDTQEKITLEGLRNSPAKIHPVGTLLVAMYGATAGKTGILAVEAATNQAVCAIFPRKNSFDPQFLQFYFIHIRPRLLRARSGGAQPNISKTIIDSLRITLPDFAEQKAIAQSLSAARDAIEARKLEIKLEHERKAALMGYLFTCGTRGESVKQTDVGKIPESWSLAALEEITLGKKGIKRGPWGGSIKKEIFVDSGYKIYEQKNVIANDFKIGDYFIDQAKFEELEDFTVQKGDVLMTAAGTMGRLAIVPENAPQGIINQALVRIRLDEIVISTSFFKSVFEFYVSNGILDKYSHGAALKNLSSTELLKNIKIALPSLKEQQYISTTLAACETKIGALEHETKLLNELFAAMLEGFMGGLLSVRPLTEVAVA